MKRILIVTSEFTGHGHKSIADALSEQFALMPDVSLDIVDGFRLMGEIGVKSSKLYGVVTRRARTLWEVAWDVTMHDSASIAAIAQLSERRFIQKIRTFRPDLILTVHSMFNGSLSRILKANNLGVPVVALQADLVNIHKTWCNRAAKMTICPTAEAYQSSIQLGMLPEELKIIGFPIRDRFCRAARDACAPDYDGCRPLRCLLMSGGEGSGNIGRYASSVLEATDAELTVICGRNKKLQEQLSPLREKYPQRMRVLGFVTEVEREMLGSDLVIARGSPNIMLEAVTMNVPLLITGALPGQERDNPHLTLSHNLGVVCERPEDMPLVIRDLTAEGGAKLAKIRRSQREYRDFDAARRVAEYVASIVEPVDYESV